MTKIIDNFPNYSITKEGIITNLKTNHVKSQWLCKNGYYYVDLQRNGLKKKIPIHRLIALHFIPNPENKRTVNHKDGDKTNNSLSNLEWATDSENIQHAYDNSLNSQRHKLKIDETTANELFLDKIMKGTSVTALALSINVGLTQLSYRMKEAAKRLNMKVEYATELKHQKLLRQSKAK